MTPKRPAHLDLGHLRTQLRQKTARSEKNLRKRHPDAVKILERAGVKPGKIREHAARIAATGALAGTLLLGGPAAQVASSGGKLVAETSSQLSTQLSESLNAVLPGTVGPLTAEQETAISQAIRKFLGIRATAQLQGERLNQSYGFIGAEQHLPRFPGDTVGEHDEYQRSGITPGRGAWGYFASSKAQLTGDLIRKEKYYVAVQTLYLPDWEKRLVYLRDWYKWRKVIVVNPVNGTSIVAVVADAGPAAWTGKHFGGSPEVMAHLGLNVGMQKGPVVLFFVDDPENQVPLGPVEYNRAR